MKTYLFSCGGVFSKQINVDWHVVRCGMSGVVCSTTHNICCLYISYCVVVGVVPYITVHLCLLNTNFQMLFEVVYEQLWCCLCF